MPAWAQTATKHAMGAPTKHPDNCLPITSFRDAIEAASDGTLLILRDDFEGNGDLLPAAKILALALNPRL